MSDQDNLRARIAGVVVRLDFEQGHKDGTVATAGDIAQAIIDEFGLTVHGDDCGYHEIHGSYDTRFGED